MIRAGIIGGAGYTAGELIRLLLAHPQARIVFVHSTSNAGNRLADVHGGLEGDTEMRLSDAYDLQAIDVLFLCSAHGESRKWMEANTVPAGVKVIDLAQDFRDESDGFVYGLPELNRDRIRTAQRVANPGCFATAIQLALLPLAAAGLLTGEVHVTAVTGSTGAGGEALSHDPFQLAFGQHLGLQSLHAPAPRGNRTQPAAAGTLVRPGGELRADARRFHAGHPGKRLHRLSAR